MIGKYMSIIDEAKKKLHSEDGSSLLIALLLFFVCLILSMSILSAAVASRPLWGTSSILRSTA